MGHSASFHFLHSASFTLETRSFHAASLALGTTPLLQWKPQARPRTTTQSESFLHASSVPMRLESSASCASATSWSHAAELIGAADAGADAAADAGADADAAADADVAADAEAAGPLAELAGGVSVVLGPPHATPASERATPDATTAARTNTGAVRAERGERDMRPRSVRFALTSTQDTRASTRHGWYKRSLVPHGWRNWQTQRI